MSLFKIMGDNHIIFNMLLIIDCSHRGYLYPCQSGYLIFKGNDLYVSEEAWFSFIIFFVGKAADFLLFLFFPLCLTFKFFTVLNPVWFPASPDLLISELGLWLSIHTHKHMHTQTGQTAWQNKPSREQEWMQEGLHMS